MFHNIGEIQFSYRATVYPISKRYDVSAVTGPLLHPFHHAVTLRPPPQYCDFTEGLSGGQHYVIVAGSVVAGDVAVAAAAAAAVAAVRADADGIKDSDECAAKGDGNVDGAGGVACKQKQAHAFGRASRNV